MHQELLVRGEHVTDIALMSVNGLLDVRTSAGTTDGDTFYDFVQKNILFLNSCHSMESINGVR